MEKYLRSHSQYELDKKSLVVEAFDAIFEPRLCPGPEAELAAEQELLELREAAIAGDVDAQVEVAIRTFGEEQRYWSCVAAN
ncbi:MAG: hypothetical protein OEM98_12740 [Gammaproteobacteria bacterium]|nr:hypothetical protein [Gammaproteobacteria bacterium]